MSINTVEQIQLAENVETNNYNLVKNIRRQ